MNFFIFLIGLGSSVDVPGSPVRLSLSEMIMLGTLPIFWSKRDRAISNQTLSTVVLLAGVYIFAAFFGDYIAGMNWSLYLRAVARPIFIVLLTLSYTLIFVKRPQLIVLFYIGLLAGSIIALALPTTSHDVENVSTEYGYFVFKYEPIFSSALSVAAYFFYRKSTLLTLIVCLAVAAPVALLGSRSNGLAYLMALGCLALFPGVEAVGGIDAKYWLQNVKRYWARALLALMTAGGVAYLAYTFAAPRGYLGDYAKEKYIQQTSSAFGATPWGIIMTGRTDALISILMIADKPLLGHGSTALSGNYGLEAAKLLDLSVNARDKYDLQHYRVGHSIFLGSWAQSGILAAIFWLAVLGYSTRIFIVALAARSDILPLIVVTYLQFAWAFMFSPLSISGRSSAALLLALAVIFADKRRPLLAARYMRWVVQPNATATNRSAVRNYGYASARSRQ